MSVISESALKAELKAGELRRVYFLFGREDFLIRTYADQIIAAAVPEDARDMNFVKYSKAPKASELSDQLDNMPFLSEYKCVLIEDLDADELDNAEHKEYLSIIGNISETGVLVIAQNNIVIETDGKGKFKPEPKAKMKKLISACGDAGCICEFKQLAADKLAKMTSKKFAGTGHSISYDNAVFLAEECGRSLTILQTEIEKLCAYKQGDDREISRGDIQQLVPRRLESNIYDLAKELFAGRTGNALHILDDLFAQKMEPILILAALSVHFTDLYRAKLGQMAKKSYDDTAAAFGYYGRAFVMDGAYRSVKNLSIDYLGDCVRILYNANRLMNSTRWDRRILIEKAITEIAYLNKR